MKILSASEMKTADNQTVIKEQIESVDLMERASMALFEQLQKDFDIQDTLFSIVCGSGNNGGDGLALARIIEQNGGAVNVYLLKSQKYSKDNFINQQRLESLNIPIRFFDLDENLEISKHSVVIDALFGYGLSRGLDFEWKNIIKQINSTDNFVVSVDLPSGLLPDSVSDKNHPIVKATKTYTFQSPKLALLLPENAIYSGEFEVLDIQLDKGSIEEIQTNYFYTTLEDIRQKTINPNRFSHKGTFGYSLIIGGSYGKIGAVVLSSKAALKTGCGLVTAYVPKCGYTVLQAAFPEAMTLTDVEDNFITEFPKDIAQFSAIGIGVGMDTKPETQKAFIRFLEDISKNQKQTKLVLDADALNILSQNKDALRFLPENTIITPHPKELERLIGSWKSDFEKLEKAMSFTKEFKLILVIKGANTCVVLPNGEFHFNATGNWGMATGGSGDVLTGIITSLLAQGYSSENATILGVFLHGLSADLQVKSIHKKSLIASDIVNGISQAWNTILG